MRLLLTLIVLTTLYSILKVCLLVQGDYLVEVRFNGYSNPTGRCGDERHCRTSGRIRCCDSSANTTDCGSQHLCDSYFTYCLRPFGDNRQPPLGCSKSHNEYRNTSSINTDDGPLNFSQNELLGLNNPQVLSGLDVAYKGVQVYIDIKDYDERSKSNDLVDLLLIDHNLTVAQTVRQNHTGFYNLVTMDLTITVLCEENFGGSDCSQCVPGFTGTNCDERDYCFGVNCSGNGQCMDGVNNYTCECTPGFSGPPCGEMDRSSGSKSSTGGDSNIGAIAGGVVGALLVVVILLILIVAVLTIILKCQCNSLKFRDANNQGNGNSSPACMPGDNPAYETGHTISGGSVTQTTTAVTKLPEREGSDSSVEERKFDNPIYGDGETDDHDNVYTAPFDQQDQHSLPNHEFDNLIYGTET